MRISIRFRFFLLVSFVCIANISGATSKNSRFVNLFIGTSGDNGQVDPGACIPFGMVRVCPDSEPRSHAGYDFSVEQVSGISVNRLSGVGCSGAGGNFSLKPSASDFDLRILKHSEKAIPGYYETEFNNGVKAELTATHNVAVERFTFPQGIESLLTFNAGSSFEKRIEESHSIVSEKELEGYVVAPNVCGRGRYKLFFNLQTNRPFTVKYNSKGQILLSFGNNNTSPVEVRIAISSVGLIAAKEENELIKSQKFSHIKSKAAGLWEEKLSRIRIKGGSSDDKVIFYTSLYRVYLSPSMVTSTNGEYLATDGKTYQANGFDYYSSWSLWDTYRTKFPLLTLLEPGIMSDISQSLVKLYQTGKVNWSTNSEATPSVRTEHAVILLLDAYRKGIKGIDFNTCYTQMCKEAEELPKNSPDQRLESAGDLWALAQIADIIGKKADAIRYSKESEELFENTWKQSFMIIDSTFIKMRDNGLYQGTRWQYRWAVPQYLDKMKEWTGGNVQLNEQLHYFFMNSLYNQGNEPDIHVPFLFNQLGSPNETHKVVHSILLGNMNHRYGGNAEFKTPYAGRVYKNDPEGFMPEMDEDDGTMGAWYVFSSMGLYPMIAGVPMYEVTSPLFDEIKIKPENGKTFIIKTKNRDNLTNHIKEIKLNRQKCNSWQLQHNTIQTGGKLELIY